MCIFVGEGGGEEGGEQIIVATEKESPRGGVFEKEKNGRKDFRVGFCGYTGERREEGEKRGITKKKRNKKGWLLRAPSSISCSLAAVTSARLFAPPHPISFSPSFSSHLFQLGFSSLKSKVLSPKSQPKWIDFYWALHPGEWCRIWFNGDLNQTTDYTFMLSCVCVCVSVLIGVFSDGPYT